MVDQGLHKLGYQYINSECGAELERVFGSTSQPPTSHPRAVCAGACAVDDCWSAKTRDANGELQPDPKQFPNGIKPGARCRNDKPTNAGPHREPTSSHLPPPPTTTTTVADYIHSKGLKFGLYLCVGTQTCRSQALEDSNHSLRQKIHNPAPPLSRPWGTPGIVRPLRAGRQDNCGLGDGLCQV